MGLQHARAIGGSSPEKRAAPTESHHDATHRPDPRIRTRVRLRQRAAEQAGLPVPAYPTLIVAGASLAEPGGDPDGCSSPAVLAALIADTFWYVTGRRFGMRVLRTLCRISLSPDSCVRADRDPSSRASGRRRCCSRSSSRASLRSRPRWPARCACAMDVPCCSTRSARCFGSAWRSASARSSATRSTMCWTCWTRWANTGSCWWSWRSSPYVAVEMVAAPALHPPAAHGPRHGRRTAQR